MGPDSRRPGPHSSLALGALVLVLCALVAATFDGPRWSPLERGEPESSSAQEEERADEPEEPTAEDSQPPQEEDEPWLPWLPPIELLVLLPVAIVFGIALVVLARLRLRKRRRQLTGRLGPRRSPDLGKEAPPDEADDGLSEAIDAGAREISEGTPRNAIVAAWVRLEQAVVSERFPRRPEETPSELVERALSSYHLDGTAIRRLAGLYKEARFSTHPVTDAHRSEAAECLRRLLATIRSGAR